MMAERLTFGSTGYWKSLRAKCRLAQLRARLDNAHANAIGRMVVPFQAPQASGYFLKAESVMLI